MTPMEILVIIVGLAVGYLAVSRILGERDERPKRPDAFKDRQPPR